MSIENTDTNITILDQSLFMDDLDIQALVDDELCEERRKQVLKAVESDPLLKQRYQELVKQKKLIRLYWESLDKIH